ncbi:ABC-F family ATP-binding cassette domain-containing protein [Pseudoxanthomonas indica]|uniref:ATPase components of ABC transporters with duplicated ATPase domains n=1 Tax=Pseudoxanthomonas indica TaxID=428993 RepID=A0A1T5LUA0_9GAMM|nr:ABC-F family ATP-binding cassette domain-containing protein [Pseudoxanthomonas indica]GGD39682.1 ABC transporter ATP-binding protein [Pseudoxanthomonas indica]SKC79607.1 ATPase components of ABC transporters with duplicated ATPase domains [Pseudoxanthomonas indica]
MTNPSLTLQGVSYVLPDGRTLFSELNESFDSTPTALVGRNGVGKTVLARLLAGQLQPSGGRCLSSGSVHYLAQQTFLPQGGTVAHLAGVESVFAALARIEAGSTAQEDFGAVGDRWDIHARLHLELQRGGLAHLDAATPAATLSGGEAMRVALLGAMLSDADFLILDEPSNHLDRPNRLALYEQLRRWPRGLLVVSHDRLLLEQMQRTVELSSLGLRSYGGNYSFYAQAKASERAKAEQDLEQAKLERQREERSMQQQRERQERRQSRGDKHGKEGNQAKIILDRQKEWSEAAGGKLRRQHYATREALSDAVREAARVVEEQTPVSLLALPVTAAAQKRVVDIDLALPHVTGATRQVTLMLTGQQRVGVVGPNGCGKSTLLKVLAGQLQPHSGQCKVLVEAVYLDQQLGNLDASRSVLEQLLDANPGGNEADLRMRLAQLGLDAQKIAAPSGVLSGGERLKAALACVLYAEPPPQLLLLDEPSNHLDLASTQALEAMLSSYRGALVVVSHDDAFLQALGLTHRLEATQTGWRLEPC